MDMADWFKGHDYLRDEESIEVITVTRELIASTYDEAQTLCEMVRVGLNLPGYGLTIIAHDHWVDGEAQERKTQYFMSFDVDYTQNG
jgi:hypothetical protein